MHASQKLLPILLAFMSFYIFPLSGLTNRTEINVGVILDWNHIVGKVSKTSITMALEDFYTKQNYYTTRIVLHHRDSISDVVEATSAAIDLLKNDQVQAILGPQRSTQANFVSNIAQKARAPIISQATSPSLSSMKNPYFIRAAQNASSQIEAITALFRAFNWGEAIVFYEDSYYGGGTVPYVTDALLKTNVQIKHISPISVSATDDYILKELYKLKTMQTRVFVVNMLPTLASRFFLMVREVGMMSEGYAWIITDGLASLLDSLDPNVITSMQGVLGVETYFPRSDAYEEFNKKWRRRFRQENPDIDRFELNVFGLWAYDSVQALAMAIERAGIAKNHYKIMESSKNLTDLDAIGTWEMGDKLLEQIRNIRFKGLSGDFHLIDGQLQSSDFRIINVIGKGEREVGFWTQKYGLSKKLVTRKISYTTNIDDLGTILWPGETNVVPRGWELPTDGEYLRVGVPIKGGFSEFVNVEKDPLTNVDTVGGFCIDVFKAVFEQNTWSYAVPYKFIPYTKDGQPVTDYNDLVDQIHLGKFDAVVGDVTILENRSKTATFSLPFTESGVTMVVPVKGDERKNAWIFLKPLRTDLWLTTGIFFVFTGFVVWVLEHRVNKEFRGPPGQQVGMIFWFSFSTMVFAHREKVTNNLTRFVVIVWVFLVLVLTSSYTASLTSMLTVQKLQPTVTDLNDLIKSGEYVGYQDGSFVGELLINKGVHRSKLRNLSSVDDFDEALTKGSKNGGVAVIVDEIPYIKLLLTNHCTKYTMVGPIYKSAGLGFAFHKGSRLVPDVSRAILSVMENNTMANIERKYFGENEADCVDQTGSQITSESLTLDSFLGLFILAGASSLVALLIFLSMFLYENRHVITSQGTILQKFSTIAKSFDQHKEEKREMMSKKTDFPTSEGILEVEFDLQESPAVRTPNQEEVEGIFSQDEGFSTTEPGTPMNEIEIVQN